MIPCSGCPLWRPDQTSDPAEDRRSYTTPKDTTQHGALPVWRDPLRWLQASRTGVVLIQPRLAAAFLCDAGPLLAEMSSMDGSSKSSSPDRRLAS
jgi:hypothetical protein